MGNPMADFKQITKTWGTRQTAALAFVLVGVCGLTLFGAIGWRALVEVSSQKAALNLTGHIAAASIAFVVLLAVIGVAFDRALIARRFHHRDIPARPEFYDYASPELPHHMKALEGSALKSLTFTVFDTETTGLRPSQGDEIISIAGVRIDAGSVQRDTVFDALVNPGFPVPKPSIRFHGITDDRLIDKPAIELVLPDFRAFVGDSILVAHNAAFDMRFLQLKEDTSGVAFHHVVLDTLLLSVFLDHDAEAHTLDAIAARLGIAIEGRHTAMGDALATAEIFMAMLDRLEARGVHSLGQVISLSHKMTAVRKLQNQF
jgi:DNA polymerase III subunit epsilon